MPSDPCYDVGDRLVLCSDDLPEVEVAFRGLDDAGRAVVIMDGYQIAVDARRLRALPSDDDEDDL